MIKINFLLIVLINSFFFSNSIIQIPFKVQNYKSESSNKKFIEDYLYKDIAINVSIGTPSQLLTLSICLGEYNTIIISKNCKGYNKGIYDENNSSTYGPDGKSDYFIFEIFSNGTNATDKFIIGNKEIDKYNFINAFEIGDNSYIDSRYYWDILTENGILGFLIQPHNNAEIDFFKFNFINQLKRNELISRYEFYFDFNSNDSGNIIIGSLPNNTGDEYYKDKIYSTIKVSKIDFNLDWAFNFDEIYYGEEKYDKDMQKQGILRIEFGMIKGTFEMEKYVKSNFFDSLLVEKKCKRETTETIGTTIYYYYCDKDIDLNKFKPVKFTINHFKTNFTFTKEDLFLDVGDKYVFLMCFGGVSLIFLGYPFIKKYKFIFNQDSKILGYFHNKPEEEIEKDPVILIVSISILSVILLGLGIFAFIYLFKMKKNKKMAKELNEEKDITYNNEGLIPNEDKN